MSESLLHGEMIIAVDFDGTITNEPSIGSTMTLKEDCKEVLTRLHEDGIVLLLWTCRTGQSLEDAVQFLVDNDMLYLFNAINDQYDEVKEKFYPDNARKLGADFYIDDKNFLAPKINWKQIERELYGEKDIDMHEVMMKSWGLK